MKTNYCHCELCADAKNTVHNKIQVEHLQYSYPFVL